MSKRVYILVTAKSYFQPKIFCSFHRPSKIQFVSRNVFLYRRKSTEGIVQRIHSGLDEMHGGGAGEEVVKEKERGGAGLLRGEGGRGWRLQSL